MVYGYENSYDHPNPLINGPQIFTVEEGRTVNLIVQCIWMGANLGVW